MIYEFQCIECGQVEEVQARPFNPPPPIPCACGKPMQRVYGCNIDTSGCRDPDEVPAKFRTSVSEEQNLTSGQVAKLEAMHGKKIEQTRRNLADGGNKGKLRMAMQIPAALHAAKIKETGDKAYWDDPKNRNRHKSCKVD